MIKPRHDIFITLVVTLWLVTPEAHYYPPKSILRGGNAEVLDILQRNNGKPEISTVLRDSSKAFLHIDNQAVTSTHRDNPKPALFAGGYPQAVLPVEYPADETLLRDTSRDILHGGNPELSALHHDNLKPFLLAVIPEISTTPHGNPKPNPHGDSLKLPKQPAALRTPNYNSKYDNLNKNHLTEDPQYVIVKKKHKKPTMLSIFKESDHKVSISKESDKTPTNKNFYLRSWKGCSKSAFKYCQKACDKAFKFVCDDRKCEKSLKKDAKKQCKQKCKAEFNDKDC